MHVVEGEVKVQVGWVVWEVRVERCVYVQQKVAI